MKHWLSSSFATLALLSVGTVGTVGCLGGQRYVVRGESASVGVDGEVTVTESQDGINALNVKLVHLPPPERHQDGHNVFVVWVKANGGPPVKAGKLAYDEGAREGTMMATTPYQEVEVVVTCESNYYGIDKPGPLVLVRTKSVRATPKLITQTVVPSNGDG